MSIHTHSEVGQTRRLRVLSDVLDVKLAAEDTAGRHTLFEVHTPPGSGVPALHTHPPSETFYVLEGKYEIYVAGPAGPQAIRATPGDAVHIPAGAPHGYKNVGERPGRMLALFDPPGRMHALFEALHGDEPDPDRLQHILERHEVVMLPPGR